MSLLLLISRRLRRRAAYALATSVAVFFLSLYLFTPDKIAQPTNEAVAVSAPATVPPPPAPPAAPPTVPAPPKLHAPGLAKVCLADDDIHLGPSERIDIPATTVFDDEGLNTGKPDDPATWRYEVKEGSLNSTAFVTLDPIFLTQKARCADVKVEMITGPLRSETAQTAAERQVFSMSDVLNYPIPATKPPVEFGKLVDDMSVKAVIVADVSESRPSPDVYFDEATKASLCLAGATKLAADLGAGLGEQTSMVVPIGGLAGVDVTYGCPSSSKEGPDVYVAWEGGPRPSAAALSIIMKAGEFVTGATQAELKRETLACVRDALKPDSAEMANREARGARIECQAFARDGGGGSVTVYRRFGPSPVRPEPTNASLAAVDAASVEIKAEREKGAADAMSFAYWYQDPSIPKEVKIFAMLAARVEALSERCPSAKSHEDKIEEWASSAGVDVSDIQPGGRYAPLMARVMLAMRAGTMKESEQEACEEARKYD